MLTAGKRRKSVRYVVNLEQLMLKRHITLRLQADTSTEDVRERPALLGKSVDDRGAGWGERGLEHV